MDDKEVNKREHMWEFIELFWLLLKEHKGDEEFQFLVGRLGLSKYDEELKTESRSWDI